MCHRILKQSAGKTCHCRGGALLPTTLVMLPLYLDTTKQNTLCGFFAGTHNKGTCLSMTLYVPDYLSAKQKVAKQLARNLSTLWVNLLPIGRLKSVKSSRLRCPRNSAPSCSLLCRLAKQGCCLFYISSDPIAAEKASAQLRNKAERQEN